MKQRKYKDIIEDLKNEYQKERISYLLRVYELSNKRGFSIQCVLNFLNKKLLTVSDEKIINDLLNELPRSNR